MDGELDGAAPKPVVLVPKANGALAAREPLEQIPIETRAQGERAALVRVVPQEQVEPGRRRKNREAARLSERFVSSAEQDQAQRARCSQNARPWIPSLSSGVDDDEVAQHEKAVGEEGGADEDGGAGDEAPGQAPLPAERPGGLERGEDQGDGEQSRPSGVEELSLEKDEGGVDGHDEASDERCRAAEDVPGHQVGQDGRAHAERELECLGEKNGGAEGRVDDAEDRRVADAVENPVVRRSGTPSGESTGGLVEQPGVDDRQLKRVGAGPGCEVQRARDERDTGYEGDVAPGPVGLATDFHARRCAFERGSRSCRTACS